VPEGEWYKRFFWHDPVRRGGVDQDVSAPGQAPKASAFLDWKLDGQHFPIAGMDRQRGIAARDVDETRHDAP